MNKVHSFVWPLFKCAAKKINLKAEEKEINNNPIIEGKYQTISTILTVKFLYVTSSLSDKLQ